MSFEGKTIGLALSGGGFRATLFGLGSVWRLNDIGLLGKLDRITSVSGGSIVSGVLAHAWSRLKFQDGRATNFAELVAAPVRELCGKTIDVGAGLKGIFTPFKTAGEYLADRYADELFGDTTLKDLPPPGAGVPRFTFYATNMQTGRSFRFRQDYIADYMLGVNHTHVVELADAVAASSAFPPIFSPVVLKTKPSDWADAKSPLENLDKLRRRIVLADGGIYDNMGLEALWDNVDLLLVSDAGAHFEIKESPWEDEVLQLGRVRDILIDQTRALRKRWLIESFSKGLRHGAYWGVGTDIADYDAPQSLTGDTKGTAALASIRTRLNAFSDKEQSQLINWGYALTDAALRSRAGIALGPAAAWPINAHLPI